MSLPIRWRLTLWYSGILLTVLLAFGAIIDVGASAAVNGGLDYDLETRLTGLESFMQKQIPRLPRARLAHTFEEHVALRPGGEMMQIADSQQNWIFRSESIIGLNLPAAGKSSPARATTQILQGVAIRVRAAVVPVNGEAYYVQLATAAGPSYLALDRFRRLLLALIPAMVFAASAGGYWLSKRALAPVDKIIEDARAISFQNISRRLAVPPARDELQRLAQTLNDMMQRLEAAFLRVTRLTADASHEFRGPIAFIRATAEVALLERGDGKSYRGALTDILLEAERSTKLIEDLLTLARADSGSVKLALIPVDVNKPLQDACSQGSALAAIKNIQLSIAVPDGTAPVLGDPDMLQRLFFILIDNAIKYTPAGGDISVELAVKHEAIVASVQDTGIGIAPDDQEQIFERFYRADKARQRDSGGAGLGLSIAQWIASAHQARIQVESTLGTGSRFSVVFNGNGVGPV
jgi:heavy metal sensor kinase